VEWQSEKDMRRVQAALSSYGLDPEMVKRLMIEYVFNGNEDQVRQRREEREPWRNERDYYYCVVIPGVEGMPRGLFVEMILVDEDEDLPEVRLVNAHKQSS